MIEIADQLMLDTTSVNVGCSFQSDSMSLDPKPPDDTLGLVLLMLQGLFFQWLIMGVYQVCLPPWKGDLFALFALCLL